MFEPLFWQMHFQVDQLPTFFAMDVFLRSSADRRRAKKRTPGHMPGASWEYL
jgi:hypothetical protein